MGNNNKTEKYNWFLIFYYIIYKNTWTQKSLPPLSVLLLFKHSELLDNLPVMSQLPVMNFQEPMLHADLTVSQTVAMPQVTELIQMLWITITISLFQKLDLATLIPSHMEDLMPFCLSIHNWTLPWILTPSRMVFANSILLELSCQLEPMRVMATAKCSWTSRWVPAMDALITKEELKFTPTKTLDVESSSNKKRRKKKRNKRKSRTLVMILLMKEAQVEMTLTLLPHQLKEIQHQRQL